MDLASRSTAPIHERSEDTASSNEYTVLTKSSADNKATIILSQLYSFAAPVLRLALLFSLPYLHSFLRFWFCALDACSAFSSRGAAAHCFWRSTSGCDCKENTGTQVQTRLWMAKPNSAISNAVTFVWVETRLELCHGTDWPAPRRISSIRQGNSLYYLKRAL